MTPGGEHADGLTRNALIPFKDGSYLELVAFVDPQDTRDNGWGWRRFLSSGGGLIDYCAASDDLRVDVRRFREGDFEMDGPTDGGRRRPDGILEGLPFHNYLIGATDSCWPPRISLDLPFGSFWCS